MDYTKFTKYLNKIGIYLNNNKIKLNIIYHNIDDNNKKHMLSCSTDNIHIVFDENYVIDSDKYYLNINDGIINGYIVVTNLFIYYNNTTIIIHFNNMRDYILSDNCIITKYNDSDNNYSNIHYYSDKITYIYEKIVN